MHHLAFGILAKEEAETVQGALSTVETYLLDNGFVSDGRWGSGISDWFVMGGRWSGELSPAYPAWRKFVKTHCKSSSEWGFTEKDIEKYETEMQKNWEDLGGQGPHPYNRGWKQKFTEDDALIWNEDVTKYFENQVKNSNKVLAGKQEESWGDSVPLIADEERFIMCWLGDYTEEENFCKYDHEKKKYTLNKKFIKEEVEGNYWITVIDYHN